MRGVADAPGLEARLQSRLLHRLLDRLLELSRFAHRIAHLQLEFHLLGKITVGHAVAGDAGIRLDVERARDGLATRGEAHAVFAGRHDRTAEAAVWSIRRPRTRVAHVPGDALHAGLGANAR